VDLPSVEDEKGSQDQAGCAYTVIPFEFFAEIGHRKNRKDTKSDHFLNGLELSCVESVRADTVGGNLKTIFEKSDAPAGDNDFPERFVAVFEVAVPGKVMKIFERVSKAMVRIESPSE
jgi:hypothetical protein